MLSSFISWMMANFRGNNLSNWQFWAYKYFHPALGKPNCNESFFLVYSLILVIGNFYLKHISSCTSINLFFILVRIPVMICTSLSKSEAKRDWEIYPLSAYNFPNRSFVLFSVTLLTSFMRIVILLYDWLSTVNIQKQSSF